MAIFVEQSKGINILELSFDANVDLSSSQWCAVSPVAQSSGRAKVGLPSGQGVYAWGILQNTPAADERADVRVHGKTKAKANAAFNAGVELTPAGTTGKLEAASSGDYVVAHSIQAASAANALVDVLVVPAYQKN